MLLLYMYVGIFRFCFTFSLNKNNSEKRFMPEMSAVYCTSINFDTLSLSLQMFR